jgi:hypothetical protein
MVLECALPPPVQRVDPGPIGRRTLWDRGASTLSSATRPVRERLPFCGELRLGLVLPLVRQVTRVFQNRLSIDPERPRNGKGRGAISQALCDFRP